MPRVHLNIGSNLGNRALNITRAVASLRQLASYGSDIRVSELIASPPWGYDSPNGYLNAGISFDTDMAPETLLEAIHSIERSIALTAEMSERGEGNESNEGDDDREVGEVGECRMGDFSGGFGIAHRNADGSYADRLIDIDIIFYGHLRCDTPELTLPHPRARMRPFVMRPVAQIDPDYLPFLENDICL